jgi:hypothetical protein
MTGLGSVGAVYQARGPVMGGLGSVGSVREVGVRS